MLIFTVKDGESFEIGNQVIVRILGRRGEQIRVGIDAPRSIGIHRTVIADRIRAENGGVIPGKEAG